MNYVSPLANHLWQSTIFAAAAMLLALALRGNRAQVRYWLWLAASVKFLVPFSLLVSLGGLIEWRAVPAVTPAVSIAVGQIGQPFTPMSMDFAPQSTPPAWQAALMGVWLCGFAGVATLWWARWRRVRSALRAATPFPLDAPIRVMSSPTLLEPGVFGILRPVLLLPAGIADRLTPEQLRAILAHELCHVRRRDNLAAAIHMAVEALFWFHPLVWWIGARLVDEREGACDEEVLAQGNAAQDYAEGIVNVCTFYLQSPLPCAAGVSGADLRRRITMIMTHRIAARLTPVRIFLLAIAATFAVAGPILVGVVRAQADTGKLTFDVASVRPADPNSNRIGIGFAPGGGANLINVDLTQAIAMAYNVPCGRNCGQYIRGGPGWINSQRFDIVAKSTREPEGLSRAVATDRTRRRLQSLLAERFQLVLAREKWEMPIYALTVAKDGPKFKESTDTSDSGGVRGGDRGEMVFFNSRLSLLTINLASTLGRHVEDRTGLTGRYDFTLEFAREGGGGEGPGGPGGKAETPGGAELSGPSVFTALQEQLGLKLESTNAPIEIFVIEKVEKPSEN